jgi:hypothetical protein
VTNPISRRTFTVGVAAGAAVAALPHPAAASTPDFTEATLWDATVGPLANYHVHGLCVLPDDTILAATEGRYEVCDAGPRDILLRRSTDRGSTWEPSQTVVPSVDGQSWGNPTFVVDRVTGEVFLFYMLSVRLQENTSCSGDTGELFVISSKDRGVTWGDPTSLSGLFDHFPYGWALHGPGPGHGIQLDTGRLLLSVSHRTIITGIPAPQRNPGVSSLYSDDHGRTWQAGGEVPMGVGPTLGEARLVQRKDGTVVINGRYGAGGNKQRGTSVSTDRGLTWAPPVLDGGTGAFNAVDASLTRHSRGRVLFSKPDSPMRWNMTVSVSYDEGYSFRYSRVVNPLRSYYSDLGVLSDGTIVLLYGCEGDIPSAPRRVAAARFTLDWLTNGRDSMATGPRLTERTHELGGSGGTVHEATARGGKRSVFTPRAVGDFVEYPFNVGADGEYELWLRYFRPVAGGLVAVTVDGRPPRNSTVDTTADVVDGYDVVLLGRQRLRRGRHTIRFTSAGAGRGGGQLISLDELSVVTARARPDVREEITIDTGELGYQAVSGTWRGSTGVPGYYGSNYLTHATGPGDAVVRYRPAIPGDDAYEVLVSHTADPNRASAAPYTVHHAGGATTVTVDQKARGVPETRGGEWVSLGTFTFNAGIDGYVELANSPTGVVIADAVRFRRRAQ